MAGGVVVMRLNGVAVAGVKASDVNHGQQHQGRGTVEMNVGDHDASALRTR